MKLSLDDSPDWAVLLTPSIYKALESQTKANLRKLCADLREGDHTTDISNALFVFLKETVVPRVEFLIGFHGCCITDEASYLKQGILRNGFNLHVTEAKMRYPAHLNIIEDTLRTLGPDYTTKSRSHVHLLLSKNVAIETGFGIQHTEGSEIFRTLARRISNNDLPSLGKPAFIECTIPLKFISASTVASATIASLLFWLTRTRGISSEPDPREGGFLVAADIQPAWMRIHYLTEKLIDGCLKATPNPNQKG